MKPGLIFTAMLALIFIGYYIINRQSTSENESFGEPKDVPFELPKKKFNLTGTWVNQIRQDTFIIEAGDGNEYLVRFHNPVSTFHGGKEKPTKYYLSGNKLTDDKYSVEISIDSANDQLSIRSFPYNRLF